MVDRVSLVMVLLILALAAGPVPASASASSTGAGDDGELVADLEGVPIPLVAVASFQCNDFEYPAIHCFKDPGMLAASLQVALSVGTVSSSDYVQFFDSNLYSGASMIASQNYEALAVIGWNDRIGSFKGKNLQTGTFYTDWFAGGSAYAFCCNQQVPSLGSYNNTFSSVYNN